MEAKEFVENRMAANNNEVIIETDKLVGKYGRYIGTIRLADSEKTLNDELVEKGFALKVSY
jgi:micrococcal nuclease